jgi:hypothetical protein
MEQGDGIGTAGNGDEKGLNRVKHVKLLEGLLYLP